MKSLLFTSILSFILVFAVSAQQAEQITVEKKGMKKVYLHGDESIDSKQLSSLLKSNSSSADMYKTSKVWSTAGLTTMACGTVFIGVGFYYTLKSAQAVGDNDLLNTTDYSNKSSNNMLIGAGFYVLSVPFLLLSNSNLKKSINLYNASSSNASLNNIDLYVGFTDDGIGIGLSF